MPRRLFALFLLLTVDVCLAAPPLAFDPDVRTGQLENGLTYFARHNEKPSGRLELRLVVRAGSVLEEDDQQGLAHFCEHMAFNGTRHFKKHDLVDYLESIGMRFGADLNAYTGFDQTVYMLQVPTDSSNTVSQGFQILRDWADGVSYEDEEIDNERGVIVEEWRLGRGAGQRIRDRQFPVLFDGSRYAARLPIGKKEVIEGAPHERLRDFYRAWYRPDLMAVVAVGDLPADELVERIRQQFGSMTNPADEKALPAWPVPDHKEVLVSAVTDPEAPGSSVTAYYKRPVAPLKTEADYRSKLVGRLFNSMLNQRLDERTRRPDPPFLSAFSHEGGFIRTKDAYFISVEAKENEVLRGLRAALTEAERVKRHGFTAAEAGRAKKDMQRRIRQAYAEREHTESGNYASAYVHDFTRDTVSPGVAAELELVTRLLPGITLDEVNALADDWMTESNRVVLANGPEKPGVTLPAEEDLSGLFDAVAAHDVPPYRDDVVDQPLLAHEPEPGAIVRRDTTNALGLTVWTLGNGARVMLKPTNFKKDQVLFLANSPGGHSRVSDDVFIPAASADGAVEACGVGGFSAVQLEKKLAGKVAGVTPYIAELQEGMRGSCSPEDLETLLQLAYLYFTAPRSDPEAFSAYKERTRDRLKNRQAQPEAAYSDEIQVTMSQGHPRRKPWTPETVDAFALPASLAVYKERFANAGDFVFLFVGAFDLKDIEPLVVKYIGGLPGTAEHERWVDLGIHPPEGPVEREVRKGEAEKSRVTLIYSGPMTWTFEERYQLQSMLAALNIRMRETIREEMGGTYSIAAYPQLIHYPRPEYRIVIAFGCAPDRVEDLTASVKAQVQALQDELLDDTYLEKVKQQQLRRREANLERNGFWLQTLSFYQWHDEDPREILAFPDRVAGLTAEAIRNAARRYFGTENVATFTLYPGP